MSYNARRIIALAIVLGTSVVGGLVTITLFDSRVASIVGVVAGAVVGVMLVLVWASRNS